MREIIHTILLNTAISDALSTPVDGLSRGHIHSVLGRIDAYQDTFAAYKKRPEKWKKPGFYSFITQALFMLSFFTVKKGFNPRQFTDYARGLPDIPECGMKIFRHSGLRIRNTLDRTFKVRNNLKIISPCAALSFSTHDPEELARNSAEIVSFFCGDESALCGSMFICLMINMIMAGGTSYSEIINPALESCSLLKGFLPGLYPLIFDKGLNPDAVSRELELMSEIIMRLEKTKGLDEAESNIISFAGEHGLNIKTAAVNHAHILLPFTMALLREYACSPEEVIFAAAGRGGPCAAASTIAGIFTSIISGPSIINSRLLSELANKKHITRLADRIAAGSAEISDLDAFTESEKSLCRKELEEYRAKNRKKDKNPEKDKKKKGRSEKNAGLHTVESWTKEDRARWKKSLKKQGHHKNI